MFHEASDQKKFNRSWFPYNKRTHKALWVFFCVIFSDQLNLLNQAGHSLRYRSLLPFKETACRTSNFSLINLSQACSAFFFFHGFLRLRLHLFRHKTELKNTFSERTITVMPVIVMYLSVLKKTGTERSSEGHGELLEELFLLLLGWIYHIQKTLILKRWTVCRCISNNVMCKLTWNPMCLVENGTAFSECFIMSENWMIEIRRLK